LQKFANNNTSRGQQHLRPGLTIVRITRNRLFDTKNIRTRKFEGIQTKSSWLGAHNNNDGRKITIDDKHHLIGQYNFSNSNYFISILFLCLATFCCLYLVQESFLDYLIRISSN